MNLPPEEPYIDPAELRGERPVVAPSRVNWGCALAASLMLLVIAGVAWITLFPRTHKLQTKTMMKGIEIALKAYQSEYNRCLLVEMQLPGDQNLVFEGEILSALVAESTKYNPRRVRFFDPPVARRKKGGAWRDESGTWRYRDDMGNQIMIRYDADQDGKTTDPDDSKIQVEAPYLLFTAGMDRDLSSTWDNLKSWQ
ncbi:hypothetical protein [Verrucomicrobium sp. BvORR106]|uniref:hypothetical protein n=1 Tax=Verrucomicrobium sp. BvORR106 TaxID=1403819 RepID=UPI002240F11E|nr:hypothetical protein [Verrucomicrobium sp. BvORR106]